MEPLLISSPRFRAPLVVLAALIVHTSLLEGLRSAGVPSDAMVLLPVTAGVVAGSERGAVVGFVAGLITDLFLQTPFGLSALAYSLVGFGVGVLQGNVIRAAWWIMPLTAFVGSAVGMVLYAVIGATVGQPHLVRPSLGVIALSVGLVNAPLSVPVGRAMAWALAGSDDRAYAAR